MVRAQLREFEKTVNISVCGFYISIDRDLLGKPVATTKRYLNRLCEVGIIETIGYIGAFEVIECVPN